MVEMWKTINNNGSPVKKNIEKTLVTQIYHCYGLSASFGVNAMMEARMMVGSILPLTRFITQMYLAQYDDDDDDDVANKTRLSY